MRPHQPGACVRRVTRATKPLLMALTVREAPHCARTGFRFLRFRLDYFHKMP
jgi:hypothetical protein